jgi:hypothetical protein
MANKPRDQFLDLPEGEHLSTEHLEEKVHQAEQQEHLLKRQLETVERQKRELEDLSRRQETLNTGRADLTEKLTRALVVLEREAIDASKRLEAIQAINSSFVHHLEVIEAINPKSWDSLEINRELTRALAAVDDAREEYMKSYPKFCADPAGEAARPANGADDAGDSASGEVKDFFGWLKIGLAISLPLLIFGLIALVVIISRLPGR